MIWDVDEDDFRDQRAVVWRKLPNAYDFRPLAFQYGLRIIHEYMIGTEITRDQHIDLLDSLVVAARQMHFGALMVTGLAQLDHRPWVDLVHLYRRLDECGIKILSVAEPWAAIDWRTHGVPPELDVWIETQHQRMAERQC